jgi:acyl-CoA hydrolase
MEVFVKVITEDLRMSERKIAATSFLTFVGLDENTNKPVEVPDVIPETEEGTKLYETAMQRAKMRKQRREESKKFAGYLTTQFPWE